MRAFLSTRDIMSALGPDKRQRATEGGIPYSTPDDSIENELVNAINRIADLEEHIFRLESKVAVLENTTWMVWLTDPVINSISLYTTRERAIISAKELDAVLIEQRIASNESTDTLERFREWAPLYIVSRVSLNKAPGWRVGESLFYKRFSDTDFIPTIVDGIVIDLQE